MPTITEVKEKIRTARDFFSEMHLERERLKREVKLLVEEQLVSLDAQKAYFAGIPRDQGPVWFGLDSWKTDCWQRRWDFCKAYEEGEQANAHFEDPSKNPYNDERPPYSTRRITLAAAWERGFQGKPI